MNESNWLTFAVFVIGFVALLGFFSKQKPGFGPYSTSTLLLILVLIFSSLLYVGGKIGDQLLANLLFAVVGFAGGLFTRKDNLAAKETAQNRGTETK